MSRAMPPDHNDQPPLNQHTHDIRLLQADYLDDLPSVFLRSRSHRLLARVLLHSLVDASLASSEPLFSTSP